jgi:hypothetical protein
MTKTTNGQQQFQNNICFIQNKKTYFSGGAGKWPLRLALNARPQGIHRGEKKALG